MGDVDRIIGALGDSSWHPVQEEHPHNCHQCGHIIEAGLMYANDWKRRHGKCHLKARVDSMTPLEREEMLLRLFEFAFGEEKEDE